MTKNYITLADLANPEGYHRRRHMDEQADIKRGELDLRAQIESYRFRQEDAHHRERMEQSDRHHEDKMGALIRADELDARKLAHTMERDRGQLELGRERLEFDRENAAASAQATRDAALIQARTTLEVTRMQQEGALTLAEVNNEHATQLAERTHRENALLVRAKHEHEITLAGVNHSHNAQLAKLAHAQSLQLAEVNHHHNTEHTALVHRQAMALSELGHMQAVDLLRAQSHITSADATTALLREKALSTIRRGEDATKHVNAAINSILVEKARGRITERLEDQKERHRANERGHELAMAENTARYARVGFTAEELVRAGFSIKEATIIVERFIAGLGARDEDEAAIYSKFDAWYAASKQ